MEFTQTIRALGNWLIPHRCIQCANALPMDSHPCCEQCYAGLPFQHHCCQRCGQVFTAEQDYCGRCLVSPPPFDGCFCPFRYKPPISEQIQRFKYSQRPELAHTLSKLLFTEIRANQLEIPELLIPAPMHISRLRERGYNQALLLTKHLSALLNIPYSNKIIEKHRATPAQAGLSLKHRKKNLRGSFRLRSSIAAKNVVIVDDVFTTGSTATEITKILKRNGVDYIRIWGLAHTV